MDEPEGERPDAKAEPKADPHAEREGRLARALRENLRRRKGLRKPPGRSQGTD